MYDKIHYKLKKKNHVLILRKKEMESQNENK